MVMRMMARLDLYNIWKPSLVDAMRQAGILVRLMARVYQRERQMAKAHLHEGIFHSPRYTMT
jgi:hypothetical protein